MAADLTPLPKINCEATSAMALSSLAQSAERFVNLLERLEKLLLDKLAKEK
jgi:hypothetical protein